MTEMVLVAFKTDKRIRGVVRQFCKRAGIREGDFYRDCVIEKLKGMGWEI